MPFRIAKADSAGARPDVTVNALRAALKHCAEADYCTDCPLYKGERCQFAGTYLAWIDRATAVIGQLAREYEGLMGDRIDRISFEPARDKMRLGAFLHAIRAEFGIKK